jgi:LmbE family N-acetylglucosaminyl deacetylase
MTINRLTVAAIDAAADSTRYTEQLAQGLAPHRVSKVYFGAMPRERLLMMRDEMRKQGKDFIPGGNAATIPIEEMGVPMADITTFVRLTDEEFEAKKKAMSAHATQLPADSPFASATPEQMREFMGTEVFQLIPWLSAHAYPVPEDDLFAGL